MIAVPINRRAAARLIPAMLPAFSSDGLRAQGMAPAPLAAAALREFRVAMAADLARHAAGVDDALVTVATPSTFDPQRAWPLLVVSATADAPYQSSRQLMRQYQAAATGAGWVVIAADPAPDVPPSKDTLPLRFALIQTALAGLAALWPRAAEAPLAFAGFSGGAKNVGWLAALATHRGDRVIGVYAAGINEETVASAARRVGVLNTAYRQLPIFLQGGDFDRVSTPAQHRAVQQALRDEGFTRVRLEFVARRHEVDPQWLPVALEWFSRLAQEAAAERSPTPSPR